jgi:predicted nucleotidyltransferase component of viral defense system
VISWVPATARFEAQLDEDAWKPLLSAALGILDDLRARGFGAPDLVLGGGTVLMMRLHHRLSKDIDLFLHDAQWLGLLTPRLNDQVASLTANYAEQANSVKLELPNGDIDFVVAGDVTGVRPSETLDFAGWSLPLESTEEILAKKLFFRAGLLKPRDVFDLVAAHRATPEPALRAVAASAPRRDTQLRRLKTLAGLSGEAAFGDVSAVGDFTGLLSTMFAEAASILENAK